MRSKRNAPQGIRIRHARSCPAVSDDERCKCSPSYEAFVYDARARRKLRKSFPTLAAARTWRADAGSSVRRSALRAPSTMTLRQAWDAWQAGAEDGTIRNRSGDTYKPSALRGYEQA